MKAKKFLVPLTRCQELEERERKRESEVAFIASSTGDIETDLGNLRLDIDNIERRVFVFVLGSAGWTWIANRDSRIPSFREADETKIRDFCREFCDEEAERLGVYRHTTTEVSCRVH